MTALVLTNDDIPEAKALGADDALTSADAFEQMKEAFGVVLNCASARVDAGKARRDLGAFFDSFFGCVAGVVFWVRGRGSRHLISNVAAEVKLWLRA